MSATLFLFVLGRAAWGVTGDVRSQKKTAEVAQVTVDYDGNTLFEIAGRQSDGHASDHADNNHDSGSARGSGHSSASAKDSGSKQTKCGTPTPKRNRHFRCSTPDCGSPPTQYMVVIANGHTYLESFQSESEVQFDLAFDKHRTKIQLNDQMTPTTDAKCNCGEIDDCDEWLTFAVGELATPEGSESENGCRHPEHAWKQLYNTGVSETAAADFKTTVNYSVGFDLEKTNTRTAEHWARGEIPPAFKTSANIMHAIEKLGPETWGPKHQKERRWPVIHDKSTAVWQYVLKCKVFNKYGMFINVAHFGSDLLVQTPFTHPPECDPNTQKCEDHCMSGHGGAF